MDTLEKTKEQQMEDIMANYRTQMGIKPAEEKKTTKVARSKRTKEELLDFVRKATFEDVKNSAEGYRNTLVQIVSAVNEEAGAVGEILSALTTLNDFEKGIIAEAERMLRRAEAEMEEKNSITDNGWNRFWGREKKIQRAKEELSAAQVGLEKAKIKAESHMSERIKNADIGEANEAYLLQCEALTRVLQEVIQNNFQEATNLKELNVNVQDMMITTSKKVKLLEEQLKEQEEKVRTAASKRGDNPAGSVEAAELEKEIGELQKEYNVTKMAYDDQLAIHNSSERFVAQSLGQLTALEETAGMLQALKSGLEADTKSRRTTYPAALQLIQSARVHTVASGASKAGIATDKKIMEISASTLSAFFNDTAQRLLQHPEDMKDMMDVLQIMAQLADDNKKVMDKYHDLLNEGYVDKKETPVG